MSIEIMQEVWKSAPVDQGTLLVLLALADSADENSRTCYPGIESLSKKSRLSERQVQYCLQRLRQTGVITVSRNASPVKTNLYRITQVSAWATYRDAIIAPHNQKAETQLATARDATHFVSDTQLVAPKPSVTSEETPDVRENDLFSGEETTLEQSAKPQVKNCEEAFERFYQAYPLKKEKKGALAKFRQAVKSGVDPEKIISAARNYSAWLDGGGKGDFRPAPKLPTTWLNKGCWDDEIEGRVHQPGVHRRSEPWGEVVR